MNCRIVISYCNASCICSEFVMFECLQETKESGKNAMSVVENQAKSSEREGAKGITVNEVLNSLHLTLFEKNSTIMCFVLGTGVTLTWWKQDNKTEDIESEETQDIIGPEPEEDNNEDDDVDINMASENEEEMEINENLVMCKFKNLIKEGNNILQC